MQKKLFIACWQTSSMKFKYLFHLLQRAMRFQSIVNDNKFVFVDWKSSDIW